MSYYFGILKFEIRWKTTCESTINMLAIIPICFWYIMDCIHSEILFWKKCHSENMARNVAVQFPSDLELQSMCACLFVYVNIWVSVCLSVCLSVGLSVWQCLSVCFHFVSGINCLRDLGSSSVQDATDATFSEPWRWPQPWNCWKYRRHVSRWISQEFYMETDVNKNGLECIRLLNEIICDFDQVFDYLKCKTRVPMLWIFSFLHYVCWKSQCTAVGLNELMSKLDNVAW